MEKIFWRSEYSVGVEEFDRQHKHLFEIISKLIDHAYSVPDLELVSKTLREMYDYAAEHFAAEEKLMQEYAYPDYDSHKKQHDYFVKTADELTSEKLESPGEIAEFLTVWWIIHILNTDMKYKDFFKDRLARSAAKAEAKKEAQTESQ